MKVQQRVPLLNFGRAVGLKLMLGRVKRFASKWLHYLGWITCLSCTTLLSACVTSPDLSKYDAIVSADGSAGEFSTLSAAISQANGKDDFYIYIKPGEYYEKLKIKTNNVHIVGAGTNNTTIYYDDYNGRIKPGAQKKVGTSGSATMTISAQNVSFSQLTIENRFDFIANESLPKGHVNKVRGTQAVALKLTVKADKILFKDVRFLGYQDTVYSNAIRALFVGGAIYGNVDFIFGSGNTVFYKTDIISVGRGKAVEVAGYVTAPSTDISNKFGLTFLQCRLLREGTVEDETYFLGRPWHPTKTFSDGRYADPNAIGKTVFINTYMDAHIHRSGWTSMGGTPKGGGPKTIFTPESSRFYEYQTKGPGASVSSERRQLSSAEAAEYTLGAILEGWPIDI